MNDRAPISVCMIVKNEAGHLEKCLASIRPFVAEIVIADTGSTDDTINSAAKFADRVEVFTACNDEQGRIESFAKARNFAFSLGTQPWKMWLDADDEVLGADHLPMITKLKTSLPLEIAFPYEWRNAKEQTTLRYFRERLISNSENFEWRGAGNIDCNVHEVICPKPNVVHQRIRFEKTIVVHRRDLIASKSTSREIGRNLRILEKAKAQGALEPRALYYLGLEYGYAGRVDEAIDTLEQYVNIAIWDDEKTQALLKLCEHYRGRGKMEDAISMALHASTVCESWSEPYFELGKCFYFRAQSTKSRRDWERCIHFFELGLAKPPHNSDLFQSPMERTVEVPRFYNMALNRCGRVQEALDVVEKALAIVGNDPHLELNRNLYRKYLNLTEEPSCSPAGSTH